MLKQIKNILVHVNKFIFVVAPKLAKHLKEKTLCLVSCLWFFSKTAIAALVAAGKKTGLALTFCMEKIKALHSLCTSFWQGTSEKTKQLVFSSSVSLLLVLSVAVFLAATCSIGFTVTANGHVVGTLKNREAYEALLGEIDKEISYVSPDGFSSTAELAFSNRIIAKNAYTADEDFKEQLKATSSNMLPAYCIYVGGEIIVALPNESAALSALDAYKNSFLQDNDVTSATFCDSVAVSRRFAPRSALRTTESALKTLEDGRIITYDLKAGESLADVAEQFDVTIDTLLRNNVIENPDNPAPCRLEIPTGEPLVYIKTVARKTLTEPIPFKTVEKEDSERYEGSLFVEQEGAEGSRVVEACITAINGVEISCNILSENVTKNAVDKVVSKGTKERPAYVGTGLMTTPANGSLSSRYGSRWGRNHNGIDISAPVGTPIYAADNGIVTYSAYNNGGYGYMIQIDHGEGVMTYYAHCNELLVEEGAVVKKGDLIARVGNTGRSTGAHLHFEVRVDGTPTDPSAYLK